ncbi:MAG: lipopolysaccharide biosynthesis protein, partial [Bythopirellula sp.]
MDWFRSKFVRNVIQATSGTAAANLLMLAALPVLSRIYSPAEFGVFAIYMAVSIMLSGMACAKYELAIPIPKEDGQAWHTLRLAMLVSVIVPLLVLIVLFAWLPESLANLGNWLYLLPIGILLDASSRAFSFWLTRQGDFAWLACGRLIQVLTVITIQAFYGLNFGGCEGLVLGFLAGGLLLFLFNGWKVRATRPMSELPPCDYRKLALRYQQYPRYLMLAHTGATFGSSLPVFFFGYYYGESIAGLFAVAMRVIDRPVQLVGQAVFQVFYPEASRQYAQQGNCAQLFTKTTRALSFFGIGLLLLMLTLAPWGARWLLGQEWAECGLMIQLLAPMLVLQLLHTPVSGLFMIANKQHVDLIWTLLRVGLVVVGLSMGLVFDTPTVAVIGLSVAGS